jgi:hypothetical protein
MAGLPTGMYFARGDRERKIHAGLQVHEKPTKLCGHDAKRFVKELTFVNRSFPVN